MVFYCFKKGHKRETKHKDFFFFKKKKIGSEFGRNEDGSTSRDGDTADDGCNGYFDAVGNAVEDLLLVVVVRGVQEVGLFVRKIVLKIMQKKKGGAKRTSGQ